MTTFLQEAICRLHHLWSYFFLSQASHFGHAEAVRVLLENHAEADFANLKGTTALMRASQEGHARISELLIGSSADVNRKNNEGMNALMLASQRGHAEMVFLLIRAGASMDEQTSQGSTALMLACKRGHEACVEALVSMGAEIFMRDSRGRTARDTALRRNHTQLLTWLNTQQQVRSVQAFKRTQRSSLLRDLRAAFDKSMLQMNPLERQSQLAMQAMKQKRLASIASALASASIKAREGTSQQGPGPGPGIEAAPGVEAGSDYDMDSHDDDSNIGFGFGSGGGSEFLSRPDQHSPSPLPQDSLGYGSWMAPRIADHRLMPSAGQPSGLRMGVGVGMGSGLAFEAASSPSIATAAMQILPPSMNSQRYSAFAPMPFGFGADPGAGARGGAGFGPEGALLKLRRSSYADWEWPALLQRYCKK